MVYHACIYPETRTYTFIILLFLLHSSETRTHINLRLPAERSPHHPDEPGIMFKRRTEERPSLIRRSLELISTRKQKAENTESFWEQNNRPDVIRVTYDGTQRI